MLGWDELMVGSQVQRAPGERQKKKQNHCPAKVFVQAADVCSQLWDEGKDGLDASSSTARV